MNDREKHQRRTRYVTICSVACLICVSWVMICTWNRMDESENKTEQTTTTLPKWPPYIREDFKVNVSDLKTEQAPTTTTIKLGTTTTTSTTTTTIRPPRGNQTKGTCNGCNDQESPGTTSTTISTSTTQATTTTSTTTSTSTSMTSPPASEFPWL